MQLANACLTRRPPDSLSTPIVYLVDSDASARAELEGLVRSAGCQARTAASAAEFLAQPRMVATSCLLVEQRLPDLSGLELQRLVADRTEMPIIFMSTSTDLRLTVQAMKAGAFEFLVKPLDPALVLRA